ncbi:conserved hypothetical protein [Listeria ivanovii FSL F6-596]|nr:conserved hypothetical protein [Listeria ivanovii FSL F6-596]
MPNYKSTKDFVQVYPFIPYQFLLLQKKKTYDEEILDTRKEILEQYFTENFGPKAKREATKFISIPEEKNMQTSTIRDLYEKNEVPLK